jgi:hypothetical protein
VPRFGVSGAIYAGAGAYAAIDIFCIGALWRPLTGTALFRIFLTLGIAVALAAGIAAWLARQDFSAWPQAIASAAAFALAGGIAYRYRRADDATTESPRGTRQ